MGKSYLKKLKGGTICLVFTILLCVSCNFESRSTSSTGTESSSQILTEQKQFDTYMSNLFGTELTGNTLNLHYTLADPKAYGIKNYEITYGDLSEKSMKKSQAQLENTCSAIKTFDYDALTTGQKMTYDILNDFLETQKKAFHYTLYDEFLRPSTGTQAELPVLLAEYTFRSNKDITDYLMLLSKTKDYFSQIIAFEERKSQAGLFMSDTSADTVIKSCRTFTKDPDNNLLISTFQNRIDAMTDIPDEKKASYISLNNSLVKNNIIPAYEKLAETLTQLKGTGKNNGGLSNFKDGVSYYEYLVRFNTGSGKDVPKLQERVKQQREDDLLRINELIVQNPALLQASVDVSLPEEDPSAILRTLQEKMTADFMPAVDSNFEINYVDPSLEATMAPAFYLTAPIDDTSHNVIYINKSSAYSGIQLFTTLAHEGYPGHLYQTTASNRSSIPPIRSILNYSGFVEGWATYVEMLSYQYADLNPDLAEILQLNQSALLSLYATVDMGIHYDSWTLSDVKNFFADYGIKEDETIQSIYKLVVEEPSHYLKYYIGYLEFLELKEYAKSIYGEAYSDKAFHQAIVTMGPAPFPILNKYLKDYYDVTIK